MRLQKAFNNNIALVLDDQGHEAVVVGPGVSFQKRPGDLVDPARVERTFRTAATGKAEQLQALFDQIPVDDIATADEVIDLAREVLGPQIDQRLLIPLADHISFALQREREGTAIAYPLAWEITHLYPQEVMLARRALDLIERRSGIRLPDVEAVPLALHFVNAQFDSTNLTKAIQMTETFGLILDLIRYEYLVQIDESSLDATRFITHLRYLFLRRERGTQVTDDLSSVEASVKATDPKAYQCATRVKQLLTDRLDWSISQEEVLFLALHIHRLTLNLS